MLLILCLAQYVAATFAGGGGDCHNIQWYQTAENTADRLSEQPPVKACDSLETDPWQSKFGVVQIHINMTATNQRIFGFGGAFTQASSSVWGKLTEPSQDQVLEAYYGSSGIGYTTGRIPINSCDFSSKIYSFDDTNTDFNLTKFDDSLQEDTFTIIPLLKAALAHQDSTVKSGRLFGSPWSPPAWMKDNNNMLSGGALKPDGETRRAWASYISRWITDYQKQIGTDIWGVTVQNEPEASQPWESCVYNATAERDFVAEHLGPVLREEHPNVKILGFDHNKDHLVDWADTLLGSDSASAPFMEGVAFHWYAGSCFENVQTVATKYPNALLLPSEACYEMTVKHDSESGNVWLHNGTWSRGEGYAQDILGDLNAGAGGWTDWNLLLDQQGGPNHEANYCDAPLIANVSDTAEGIFFHPQYFYIGHFSKFLLPGSSRVGAQVVPATGQMMDPAPDCVGWPAYGLCKNDTLQTTAFQRQDGKVATVVLNCADNSMPFEMTFNGKTLQNTAPAHSIQTYLLD